MAHIHQHEHQPDITIRAEISADKSRPPFLLRFSDLRIAVAGKIDEINIVYPVEIYGSCLSGNRAYSRQILPVEELVYQSGFSNVGKTGKGYLNVLAGRYLGEFSV